ncbi:MAG TPA: L-serine ammonia-lyase, iron-sulfur-dependent, subunit alpha [Tissierellaceae bacterium]|nr:L-serine ammonia-lyase, iron-sulfur-dependent, subunit alpha [Tissierellaceae bacterium]
MFNTAAELLEQCKAVNKSISHIVMDKEVTGTGLTLKEVKEKMGDILKVMKKSATASLDEEKISVSGLTGGNAKRLNDYSKKGKTLSGPFINHAMAMAFSTSEVNASMGKIVAAPTAGAAGILPAALLSAQEKLNLSDQDMIRGLFTAAGVGEIIAKNATISGAEGGCQAECGAAAAMAAAAIVEMSGGSPKASLDAAGFALTNILGLVCDPIAGLVEYPCALRNASGVINAFISADMALAGVQALIPFDEVVDAMYQIGKSMPEDLRETAQGGLADTVTGRNYAEKFHKQ